MYKMLINIKTRHFHSSIYHQEQFFHRTLITGYFRLVNIAKFLGTGFFIEYLQKQLFADIPQNRYSKTSQEAFVLQSLFKKTCRLKACNCLQLHKKRLQHRCFPVKFAKFWRIAFLTEHLRWMLLHLRWLLLHCFKKVLFNSYFATLLWRTNNFFFSTHRLMYKLVCLWICRHLSSFPNNSIRVYPVKLKIGILDHMNNTFRNTVF